MCGGSAHLGRRDAGFLVGIVLLILRFWDVHEVSAAGPEVIGEFGPVVDLPVVPIHTHLLPTGRVLFWDREHLAAGWDPTPRLWDPESGAITTTPPAPYQVFCGGHTFLADGRLLVAGGHISDFIGESRAAVYDPFNNSWALLPSMLTGRWYPSCTTLSDGSVFVEAGTINRTRGVNPLPQVWSPQTGVWRWLEAADHTWGGFPDWADFYPFIYAAPDGRAFIAGPQQIARYVATTGSGAISDVTASELSYRDYGSSAMYDAGKVLIVGGNPRESFSPPRIVPSQTAEVIDLTQSMPHWRRVADMSVGRRHLTATLLPTGHVLVTGGTSAPGFDNPAGAVLHAELWDPASETWTTLASHSVYRGYHSVALLLPDGRVIVGGGGHPDPFGEAQHNNMEIYSPPYLFKGPRPTVTGYDATLTYQSQVDVDTPDADTIAEANLLRLGSVTHGFNQNQRICRLGTPQVVPGGVTVAAPMDARLCPPGHYMLFLVNAAGVPSIGKIVQLRTGAPGPTRTPTATATRTPSPMQPPTASPTATRTPTQPPTSTPTASVTPTAVRTATPSGTRTTTHTPTPTDTPAGSIAGVIRYYDTGVPVPDADVFIRNTTGESAQTSSAQGGYVFDPVTTTDWKVEPRKIGDARAGISVLDAAYALQHAIGSNTLDPLQQLACDVTGNGTVSVLDSSLILRFVLGMTTRFPVAQTCASDWAFWPAPLAIVNQHVVQPSMHVGTCVRGAIELSPLAGRISQQDFLGLLFGDCTRNWGSVTSGSGAAPDVEIDRARLRLGHAQELPGRRLRVPLYIDTPETFRAADVRLRYDHRALRLRAVRRGPGAAAALVESHSENHGMVHVVFAAAEPVDGTRVHPLVIEFQVRAAVRRSLVRAVHIGVYQ